MTTTTVSFLVAFAAAVSGLASTAGNDAFPCAPRDFNWGSVVCVCNSSYCDTLPRFQRPPGSTALVYTSTKSGLRFHKTTAPIQEGMVPSAFFSLQHLAIDRKAKFQEVIGFGGALTDGVGENLKSISDSAQEFLLRSYFSEDGIEYNIGRVPIGGSDFSSRKYSYQDDSEDKSLRDFKLQREDHELKIPFIKRAIEMLPEDAGGLLLFAACWSPPKWMKTSNKFEGFGFLRSTHYQSYADYHIKFLDAYKEQGLTFYSISTGNEPLNGVFPVYGFNSLGWIPQTHRTWISQHFGPTLRDSNHSKVLLLAMDDQRYLLPWWLNVIMADTKVNEYVDGIAVHWYGNFITPSSLLDMVHNKYPDKFIISTEASNGDKPWDFTKVQLGSWTRGVYYMGDIIDVMNHWSTGWVDWNLAVNTVGGPNWKKNYVDAPIVVNSAAGEFYKQPTYYALGHFSKFVPKGSRRVGVTSEGGPSLFGKVQHIAFERPDGGIVVVLLNRHNNPRDVLIEDGGRGHISLQIQPNSFTSVLFWDGAAPSSRATAVGVGSVSLLVAACALTTYQLNHP